MIASHTVARFQANQADVDKSIKITVEVNLMSKMYELYKTYGADGFPLPTGALAFFVFAGTFLAAAQSATNPSSIVKVTSASWSCRTKTFL